MARVTGKYDVGFERGDGGLKSVFGTFIGTRLKENKEKYARELKAADPKNAYSILSDLMKERRQLVQQMGRAQRDAVKAASSGPRTKYSRSSGGGSAIQGRAMLELYQNKQKQKLSVQQGVSWANTRDAKGAMHNIFIRMKKEDPQAALTLWRSLVTNAKLGNEFHELGAAHEMKKFLEGKLRKKEISEDQFRKASAYLASAFGLTRGAIKEDPDGRVESVGFSKSDYELLASLPGGGPKETVTTYGQKVTFDPEKITEAYKPTLDDLDAQIKKAKEDYETAKREYKGMIKGPDYNMALAPLSSRPSALSQSLSKYGRLREVDPSYAREAMAASEEEGKFVLPTPYEDLVSIEGAGGKSPINLMVEIAETLSAMRGHSTKGWLSPTLRDAKGSDERIELDIETGEAKFPDLTPEDVEFVDSSVSRMLASLNSPLYKGADYDGVREILETYEKEKKSPELMKHPENIQSVLKVDLANWLADEMSAWEGSLSQDRIIDMSKKDKAEIRVADSIRESQAAYDKFLQTRDAEQYRSEIAKTYSNLLNTPAEQRGLVGDAYLNEIERYESVDPSRRLPEELNFKLQGLLLAADEIATRGVLKPGYEGELPEAVPATKPEEHEGDVTRLPIEMKVDEQYDT